MTDEVQGVAAAQLLSIVERIERLNEEIKDLDGDKSEVFKEAKANGYDTKALKKIIALRRKDASEREQEEAILELYKNALGMA